MTNNSEHTNARGCSKDFTFTTLFNLQFYEVHVLLMPVYAEEMEAQRGRLSDVAQDQTPRAAELVFKLMQAGFRTPDLNNHTHRLPALLLHQNGTRTSSLHEKHSDPTTQVQWPQCII